MFNLIRRISYGVIPRSDRPWEEDPTSNAPTLGRKRRLSSTERDVRDEGDQANKKKARGESATPSVADADSSSPVQVAPVDTQEVKEVTQGVEDVALEGKDVMETPSDEKAAPETVPLPEEKSGELDEPESDPATLSVHLPTPIPDQVAATPQAADDASSESVPAADGLSSTSSLPTKEDPLVANNEVETSSLTNESSTKADATEN